jgi:hypothetical protein
MKKLKSPEKRQEEVQIIMEKFLDLGFPLDHPGTQTFIKITNDFVNHGYNASGTINFKEFGRVMEYIFSMQPHIESRVALKSA